MHCLVLIFGKQKEWKKYVYLLYDRAHSYQFIIFIFLFFSEPSGLFM